MYKNGRAIGNNSPFQSRKINLGGVRMKLAIRLMLIIAVYLVVGCFFAYNRSI